MIPSETQIAREQSFLPGLGRMQAINRIRQREAIMRDRRMAPVPLITARCVEPDARLVELLAKDAPLTSAEWAEITVFERDSV